MTNPILDIQNLTAGYSQGVGKPSINVVKDVSETLHAGELVCVIGPNGAGKSTLLRTIAGMQPAIKGHIKLMGKDIRVMKASERALQLSLVLTQKMDVGFVSGYDLVALGRSPYTGWMGQLSAHDHSVIQEAIRLVGAQNLADRIFDTMSDGERQKILIARALAQEPTLMILDEPTAFLDFPRRVECMSLLRELAHRTKRTIILSSHDLDLALRYADRIWLLPYNGELRIGMPEDLVLSGAFQSTFENMGVQFDMSSGTFQTVHRTNKKIVLLGSGGINHFWTQRALEREGFTVEAEYTSGLTTVDLVEENNRCRWIINKDDLTPCTSLAQLIKALSVKDISL